jgi:hypothetical protein
MEARGQLYATPNSSPLLLVRSLALLSSYKYVRTSICYYRLHVVVTLKVRNNLQDLIIDGKTILKCTLKCGGVGVHCIHLARDRDIWLLLCTL